MGRAQQLHPQAPIAQVLSKRRPNDNELATIKAIAAMDENQPGILAGANTLTNVFNQSDDENKRACIAFAKAYLGDIIITLPQGTTLLDMAAFVHGLINRTPNQDKIALVQHIGQDAILKTAIVNPEMAKLAFEFLLLPLGVKRKKWLYFSLHIEQLIKQISINQDIFSGPDRNDADQPYIAQLLLLYYHWPTLRDTFKQTLDQSLGDTLSETIHQYKHLLQSEVSQNFTPLIASHHPIKPAQTLNIQQAIARLTPDELAWFTYNCYTNEPTEFGAIEPNSNLNSQLSKLIQAYGREALLITLHERNKPQINQQIIERVNQHFDKIVKDLSYHSRYWLFLSLLLEDNSDYFSASITPPSGTQAQICKSCLDLAYLNPTITRLMHQRLVARIPEGKTAELINVIQRFIRDSANTFSDQMRLWQYLSLTTNSTPSFFSMMGAQLHERHFGNVFYRTVISPLSDHFARLSSYSAFLRKTVQDALLNNTEQNPNFEKSVSQLGLYQSYSFHSLLKQCDPNTLCWLYFSLMTNMYSQSNLTLGEKLTVIKPVERAAQHANQVLEVVTANPASGKLILKEIESLIPSEHIQLLKAFNARFLQMKLNAISRDAKRWLYVALKTLTVENIFQAGTKNPIALPADDKRDLAKILYIVENDVALIPEAVAFLLEKCPEMAEVKPEDDNFSFFAFNQCDTGEFGALMSLSEQRSHEILPMLLKSTAKATKGWLKESLTSGIIDSRLLLHALPSEMSEQVAHELALVPNLLTLALQWPSVRTRLIQECGGSAENIQPLSQLILDKFQFSGKGMSALALAIEPQCQQLTHFSAVGTQLTDEGLSLISHSIMGKAPLKVFQIHHNKALSASALANVIWIANARVNPLQQAFVSTALVTCLEDPLVMGWLILKLESLNNEYYHNILQNNELFYLPPHLKDKFYLANALFEDCKATPAKIANIYQMLKFMVSPLLVNNQLVHSAVKAAQSPFIYQAMIHIFESHKTNNIKSWLIKTLMTGKIEVNNTQTFSEQEMLVVQQLSCLLLVSSQDQRFALGQLLGMTAQQAYPNISQIEIRQVLYHPCLLATLLQALEKADTLSHISLEAMSLDNDAISQLTNALKTKAHLKSLNVSANPITTDGASMLARLLTHNHAIKDFTMNNCDCGEEGFIEIANSLSHSKLESLSAHNAPENCRTYKPIKERGFRALTSALAAPGCTLKHLDLSYNEGSNIGAQHLFAGISKGKSSLKAVKLNHNQVGDLGLMRLAEALGTPSSLTHVEIDGHHAKPKTLEAIAQKLKHNTNISHFEVTPDYVLQEPDEGEMNEAAKEAREILARIKDTVSQNATEKQVTRRLRRLAISEDSTESGSPLRRCSSLPAFDLPSEAPVLRFSGQMRRTQQDPKQTSNSATISHKFAFVK